MGTFTVGDDVVGVDLGMFDTGVLAAYLIDAPNPTLIETGFARSAGTLLDGVREAGVDPAELTHAVISHVHLDHAGGATELVTAAPELQVHIHDSTADYLLDPGPLIESTERAMGDHFRTMGAPAPLPEANLVRVTDGDTVDCGDRMLEVVATPGHSPDHIAIWDQDSGRLFVNEGIGSYYGQADRWLPPATLPRFDVEAVRQTIDHLRELGPDQLVLSHFGARDEPPAAFDAAMACLDQFDDRIPTLYDEMDGDLEATEDRVREDLVALTPAYDEQLAVFEAQFQTRGFLRYHDRV